MTISDNPKILIVEDDPDLANLMADYLGLHRFEVSIAGNAEQAMVMIKQNPPVLIILDIMLPGMSGMDLCRLIRPTYQGAIIMLTAMDEDSDQMLGLELGADDYVIKPVKPPLLLSRIKAVLRRLEKPSTTKNTELVIRIDKIQRQASVNSKKVSLTTAEYELLVLLYDHAGEIVSRDQMIKSLRGFEYDGEDRSIDRRISRLRRKLGDHCEQPDMIKTVRGKGYFLAQQKSTDSR